MVSIREHLPTAQGALDVGLWYQHLSRRTGRDLPSVAAACDFVQGKIVQDAPHPTRDDALSMGVHIADTLSYFLVDEVALCACILYRVARLGLADACELKAHFGADVALVVQETLSLGHLADAIEQNPRIESLVMDDNKNALANIYKMIINTTTDVRVVLIKLCERTCAIRRLGNATAPRQIRVASEIMGIYAPLAHRLGLGELKWELEDAAFRYLRPLAYQSIAQRLAKKRTLRERYIAEVQATLKDALDQEGIEGQISGRVKHIYSIWRKMHKKNLEFDELYDIRALRVLVPKKYQCYHVLGVVHALWRHVPEQFDDYIANPKPNGYRSLHTVVVAQGETVEIQIRTHQMHFEAELGACAHVNYKEGGRFDKGLNDKVANLRALLGNQNDPAKLVEEAPKSTYVFSPQGEVVELPLGATVLDFAYYVHTEVGNRATGARVNDRFVPLDFVPQTGDQIDIITKKDKTPSQEWLKPSTGYLKTSRARAKLRQWFNRQNKCAHQEEGRAILSQILSDYNLTQDAITPAILTPLGVRDVDALCLGLCTKEITPKRVRRYLAPKPIPAPITGRVRTGKFGVILPELEGALLSMAKCCRPVHGEPIQGYITKGAGVRIHRASCSEFLRLIQVEPARKTPAIWDTKDASWQTTGLGLRVFERPGILRSITGLLDKEGVNVRHIQTFQDAGEQMRILLLIELLGIAQLARLMLRLEQVSGVSEVWRE